MSSQLEERLTTSLARGTSSFLLLGVFPGVREVKGNLTTLSYESFSGQYRVLYEAGSDQLQAPDVSLCSPAQAVRGGTSSFPSEKSLVASAGGQLRHHHLDVHLLHHHQHSVQQDSR